MFLSADFPDRLSYRRFLVAYAPSNFPVPTWRWRIWDTDGSVCALHLSLLRSTRVDQERHFLPAVITRFQLQLWPDTRDKKTRTES